MTIDSTFPVQPGDIIAGRYRVDRVLGVGGMGVVVAAHHVHLDHPVAVKFLLPAVLSNAEAVNRFAREARAAVKIQNEHVARVTDVGTLETGEPYMVMEYLEGQDLAELVKRQGPLAVDDAVDFVLQALEAIAEAHRLGIVHRDLKPSNLFLARRPDGSHIVKVLDFGISKTSGMAGSGASAAMTGTTTMMGSPLYMSPEQLSSARDVDARADIWALGIILHELLTGLLPFVGDTIPQLCIAIMNANPRPAQALRPDMPARLGAVILRCIEKDRARRFANVGELATALAEFAPARSRGSIERIAQLFFRITGNPTKTNQLASNQVEAPSSETATSGFGTQSTWHKTGALRAKGNSRKAIAVAAGVAVTLLVVVALFLLRKGPSEITPSSPSVVDERAAANRPASPPEIAPAAALSNNPPPVAPPAESPFVETERSRPEPEIPPASAPTRLPKSITTRPASPTPVSHPATAAPHKAHGQPGGAWEDDRK